MGIVTALLAMAELALQLWVSKDKRKYIDQIASIKQAYYEEENKPDADRSDAVMDNLREQLCLVAASIQADAGQPTPTPPPAS